MGLIRIAKTASNYYMAHKYYVEDTRLSFKAKGIMSYLLSKPDDWTIYQAEVAKASKDGKASVRSAFNELLELGYLTREVARKENGDFNGYTYTLYEIPVNEIGEVRKMEYAKMVDAEMGNAKMVDAKSHTTNNYLTNNYLTNNNTTNNNSSSSYTNNISNTNITSINNKQTNNKQQQQQQLNVFDFYQENGFGMLTPNTVQKLNAWITDFNDNEEIIIEALKEADENNVRKWAYVNSILKSWYSKNVKTLNDINALRNERQATNYKQDKNLNDELDLMERKKYDASLWD